ncbi:MAG: M1 family metallopeptidase, partial [Pseudomonadota bacterium]
RYGAGAGTVNIQALARGMWVRCLAGVLFAWLAATGAWAQTGWRVAQFNLELEPRFETQTIHGTLRMDFVVQQVALPHVTLDAGSLHIHAVELAGQPLPFEKTGSQLRITLPAKLRLQKLQQLQVRYTGEGSSGLRFDPASPQVATAFSTSQWMPCLDDPAVRAPFGLRLLLPPDLVSVGNGSPSPPQRHSDGRRSHNWRLDHAMPSYLYGFAAGPFAQAQAMAGKTRLEYFGPSSQFTPAQLQQVFADSADMLAFFEKRAGVPYPLKTYRQVLLAGPAAQEMAGYSVMGVRYGKRVLDKPEAIWLGAHEMAHQWWGNGLTNRSWRHFWLNEGIATFMTAAYLEHRFGVQTYADNIEAARSKYLAIQAAGQDRSLVFPDWDKPTATDRSLVYDKGALVVHELRNLLGDAKFWKGLRHYTRKHWGQSVETADFKKAMEEGSGADLTAFFTQWVEAR